MKIRLYAIYASILLLFTCFYSCKKMDYDDGFVTMSEVYFENNSILSSDLGIKIKGEPVDWATENQGKIKVPTGEHTFAFYDKRNDEILGEKKVNVIAGSPETFIVFHPESDAPLAFLDSQAQVEEEAAPEGFYKIKIANYAPDLLPEKIDIIIMAEKFNWDTWEVSYEELMKIEDIGRNLGEEIYREIPKPSGDITAIVFNFRDATSGADVLNHGGQPYSNAYFMPEYEYPNVEKDVYTVYLVPMEGWGENDAFIKFGDKYWDIQPKILFAD